VVKVVLLFVQGLGLAIGAAIFHFGFIFGNQSYITLLIATTIYLWVYHGIAMGYCFNLGSLRISTRMNYDRGSAVHCNLGTRHL
jgi:hypothetical protein